MAIKTFTDNTTLPASDINTFLANSGLVYVKSQTIGTAVSSVAVTDAFSATYDNYKIVMQGGAASAGNCNLQFQFAGVTGANFYGSWFGARYTTGAFAGLAINGTTSWTYAGQHLNNNHVMNIDIWGANKTTRKYLTNGFFIAIGTGDFGMSIVESTASTAETAFNIIPSSGTLTGGTITVYGYRKA